MCISTNKWLTGRAGTTLACVACGLDVLLLSAIACAFASRTSEARAAGALNTAVLSGSLLARALTSLLLAAGTLGLLSCVENDELEIL